MTPQHLSDEAVAAFADGVLGGHARERASRHVNGCAECRHAVRVQREAAFALRSAVAPALPTGLLDRLRVVPQTTPISSLPTAIAPDGSTMLATFAGFGQAAALVPPPAEHRAHRIRPFVTTAAVVALAGVLAAGSAVAQQDEPANSGSPTTVSHTRTHGAPVAPVDSINELTGFHALQH